MRNRNRRTLMGSPAVKKVAFLLVIIVALNQYKYNWSPSTENPSTSLLLLPQSPTKKCPCQIGSPPWRNVDLREALHDFVPIYKRRPGDGINSGGGGFFHYFALFVTIRSLQPITTVIESGAHMGVGTWFLRQSAGPDAKLIVITPNMPKVYQDPQATYFTDSTFQDFKDIDWKTQAIDFRKTLVFVDDHQSTFRRMQEAKNIGFRHMVFDDNYPPGEGDFTSVKKLCDPSVWQLLGKADQKLFFEDNFGRTRKAISEQDFEQMVEQFRTLAKVYAEFPPVWDGGNFHKLPQHLFEQISCPPLFQRDQITATGLTIDLELESQKYMIITYAEVAH